jgi:hypothetical protein
LGKDLSIQKWKIMIKRHAELAMIANILRTENLKTVLCIQLRRVNKKQD